ncbi:hypothetical protein H0X32_02250 [Patescibacteria group bacterium]|nr:hypothetical protein [Patescibacteria group bacterium]
MKSPEKWGSKSPSGHDIDLGQWSEQIEKGTKYGRIPVAEAYQVLKGFKEQHLSNVEPLSSPSADLEEKVLDLMDVIKEGVKAGAIPADEAVRVFEELNQKYPVEEENA